jgi:T5SS/PEP-CTERM-associated repeat protein
MRTNNANFTSNATYNVTWTGGVSNANAFFNASSGTVTQSIGAFVWLLTNSYVVGQNPGSSPTVTHANGTLRVTNSSGSALLDLRRGTTRLNGGVIDVDRLLMTNGVGILEFNGGTLITRGGVVSNNNFSFTIGEDGSTPAIWSARAGADTVISNSIAVGGGVSGCQLLITNGGKVFSRSATVGAGSTVSNNVAFISGSGSVWSNTLGLSLGSGASLNSLIISNGGVLLSPNGHVGINGSSANSNTVIVTGAGATWSNISSVFVMGYSSRGNRMIITNGGAVYNTVGIMGFDDTSIANAALVTGPNSVWDNSISLTVGQSGSSNQLVIQNSGAVLADGFTLGQTSTSTNNQTLVDSGVLRVTNASRTGGHGRTQGKFLPE